eukprot:TRINITY_DN2055_c0_g2_i1.p2 TRINITY_DN2055_c0_g2~~TRINITY_DN2055_c0_g2_i1.p2  ORF type:complete len:108 (+),score=5.14 TRINITY_DN2055_c0_g2_i1:316-639(+)
MSHCPLCLSCIFYHFFCFSSASSVVFFVCVPVFSIGHAVIAFRVYCCCQLISPRLLFTHNPSTLAMDQLSDTCTCHFFYRRTREDNPMADNVDDLQHVFVKLKYSYR